MPRILSKQLSKFLDQEVEIQGWLHKVRRLGSLMFIVLRDRSGLIQIVVEDALEQAKFDGIYQGSILKIRGQVKADARAHFGVEIHKPFIEVVVPVAFVSPIEIDKPLGHSERELDTLFEHRPLTLRNTFEADIFKIQDEVQVLIREFFKSHDFTEFHSPKLLAEATEGGAEVFKLDYFKGKKATLAQSAQFYKQIMVGVYERVFEIGATYRAEPSVTSRHMSEFITIDAEMGFIEGLADIQDCLGDLLIYIVDKLWEIENDRLGHLKATKPILTAKIPEITLVKLHELYFQKTGQDLRKEPDPSTVEERWICEYSTKEWGCEAVFITEFPSSHAKFYHFISETNLAVAERADLIFRGVEIATLSRREHRYDKLVEQLGKIGASPESEGYRHYMSTFKYGMPSHGGFGLGLERLTQKILGLSNVKEAALFPRDTSRLAP